MKKQQGFSLIELLIVVAVIGIIAAIAVPNLVQSRAAANEASAISSVRTVVTAQLTFAATAGNGQYAADLAALQAAQLIDQALASGLKDGYNFACQGAGQTFTVNANPQIVGTTGNRAFFSDETAVIRWVAGGGPAGAGDNPLGM